MRHQLLLLKLLLVTFFLTFVDVDVYSETLSYKQSARNETKSFSLPQGAKVVFKTTYPNNSYVQLTDSYNMTYSFSSFDGCTIKGIILSMKSNQKSGKGSLKVTIGNKTIAEIADSKFNEKNWNGAWSESFIDVKPNVTATKVGVGETLVIQIAASENSLYCQGVTVEFDMPDSYVASPSLPESCEFIDSKEVTITNNASGSTVYYTTDGTEPSASSMEYTLPFTITETTTVKAVAVKDGKASDVVEATYTEFVPECILPGVSPVGGDSEATAVMIKQHSKITIIPAKFNEVTYSLNGSATTVITEKEDIVIENAGKLVLTITSAVADETESVIYYYDVVEAFPEITAILVKDDIKGSVAQGNEGYNKNNSVVGTCGVWTGYFAASKDNGYLQLNQKDGYHILSPEFPGRIISVSVTFTVSTTGNDSRGFVIMPTDFMGVTATSSMKDCLGSASYKGKDNPTSTVTLKENDNITSFKIYATGGAIYFSQIEVVYEKPADYVLEVGPSGWATIYLGLDAAIPDGLKCYAISSVTDNIAILSSLTNTLPAHSGVIVKGIPNTNYTFAYNNNYAGNADVENLLRGTLSNEYLSSPIYVLSNPNDVVGLYSAKEADGKFLNNANKAYLPADAVPAASLSQGLRFSSQDPTSIIETERSITPNGDAVIYDLTGRRVERMGKGIYIVNGKKVINN